MQKALYLVSYDFKMNALILLCQVNVRQTHTHLLIFSLQQPDLEFLASTTLLT